MRYLSTGCLALALAIGAALPATAQAGPATPYSVDPMDALKYRALFAQLDGQQWEAARASILALDADDPLRGYALAEVYLAKGSPRVDLFDLIDLINKAPDLPQMERLTALARKRGATVLPDRPQVQKLMWVGMGPQRGILGSVRGDPVADSIAPAILARIKADDPAGGEALLDGISAGLGSDARTEWQQRLAWSYYIENDTANARRLAGNALSGGTGAFLAPVAWVAGLAAWREQDYAAAAQAFTTVAGRSSDDDMRAAGAYWAARAYMAAGQPARVEPMLRAAARYEECFYGLLARESLGLAPSAQLVRTPLSARDWAELKALPNVRVATILAAIGREGDADAALRYQAQLDGGEHHRALVNLATELNLPSAQLWLAQRAPDGRKVPAYARYPEPNWTPDGGWRVDRALVFAHALQESRFRADVVSPAGARGVMQVMPGTAAEMAARDGRSVSAADLARPSTNIEYGQRFLEKLRDMSATGGLLPKVMAAYNAGPQPIERWRTEVRDNGDPLLFIESLPYYETRAYVNVVMRNYWMYQLQETGRSDALTATAQGLWVRFPGLKGQYAVRVTANGTGYGAD
jgi:soluble lytic murein transglycosylase-like protein